jgi:putative redox protein
MDLITATNEAGRGWILRLRKHELAVDPEAAAGGTDRGPSPVELLAAALGACVGMTVEAWCRARGYTDGPVAVNLTFAVGDLPKRVTTFTLDIELPRDVPAGKHALIKRLVQGCPVHRTLTNQPVIDVEVVS